MPSPLQPESYRHAALKLQMMRCDARPSEHLSISTDISIVAVVVPAELAFVILSRQKPGLRRRFDTGTLKNPLLKLNALVALRESAVGREVELGVTVAPDRCGNSPERFRRIHQYRGRSTPNLITESSH